MQKTGVVANAKTERFYRIELTRKRRKCRCVQVFCESILNGETLLFLRFTVKKIDSRKWWQSHCDIAIFTIARKLWFSPFVCVWQHILTCAHLFVSRLISFRSYFHVAARKEGSRKVCFFYSRRKRRLREIRMDIIICAWKYTFTIYVYRYASNLRAIMREETRRVVCI